MAKPSDKQITEQVKPTPAVIPVWMRTKSEANRTRKERQEHFEKK